MADRKSIKKYIFTVEGETEKWYLTRLQNIINNSSNSQYNVSFDCQIQKNPLKRAKSLSITQMTNVYHFSDYESDEPLHVQQFIETMDNMQKANRIGKQLKYNFGYSNLTFDLWIVLHKSHCNGCLVHRSHYLNPINRAFNENFESMDDYKHEDNFKRVLSKIQLEDVQNAVNRSKTIMNRNIENQYTLHEYKGFKYYKENPSLSVGDIVGMILSDCGLIQN